MIYRRVSPDGQHWIDRPLEAERAVSERSDSHSLGLQTIIAEIESRLTIAANHSSLL